MVAIVFLSSMNEGAKLAHLLSTIGSFDSVVHVTSRDDYHTGIKDNPRAACFFASPMDAPCTSSQYWVAVGKTDAEAIRAFAFSAHGFIHLPLRPQQVSMVVAEVCWQEHLAQQRRKFNALIKGVCQQYGLSRHALSATLRRRYAQYRAPALITVKTHDGLCRLALHDVLWVEAQGDYMKIHLVKQEVVVRATLLSLLQQLGSQHFLRCNRSIAVNIHQLADIDRLDGRVSVLLNNGKRIKVSPRYQHCGWQLLYKQQDAEPIRRCR